MTVISSNTEEVLSLSRQLREDSGLRAWLIRKYWKASFDITRLFETKIDQSKRLNSDLKILNFGCGVKRYDSAINSDLYAIHRRLRRKVRPDLYWSGTNALSYLEQRFTGIVCEHVIEHMLPDDAVTLFMNFRRAMTNNGVLVVSFPDVAKVLAGGLCQGYESKVASVNSVIYCHGHTFMYDSETVVDLLRVAGFSTVRISACHELPLSEYIGRGRSPESSYVVAECAKSPSSFG
jgi:predicted SAM-dependent methyltransferase